MKMYALNNLIYSTVLLAISNFKREVFFVVVVIFVLPLLCPFLSEIL